MASFAGARAGVAGVDAVVALAIAAFIAVLGVRILVGSFHTLTDRAVIAPEIAGGVVHERPRGALLPRGPHARRAGRRLRGPHRARGRHLTLRQAHDVADAIEEAVQRASSRDRGRGGAPGARGGDEARARGRSLDLRPSDVEAAGPAPAGQFLGRFNQGALERELEAAGILAALAARGYPKVRLRTDVVGGEHRLRIVRPRATRSRWSSCGSPRSRSWWRTPSCATRAWTSCTRSPCTGSRCRIPASRSPRTAPACPASGIPGLGFGRRFYGRLMTWAHEWGKDALLNFPEYYHNAVFYSSMFRFVSPARQGRLEALRRDLGGLDVCEASAAVNEGRVVEEGEPGGAPFRWEPAEMISPVTASVTHALDSDAYKRAMAAARDAAKFRVTSR